MKERRYKEDYVLESYIDEKGREKRRSVYRGEWYTADPAQMKALARWALLTALVFAAAFFAYLGTNAPSTYCIAVLPLASCALFPLMYWAMGVFSMRRAPEKMTRVQKETGIGRVLRSSVACAVLVGAACVGDAVYMALWLRERAGEEFLAFALLLCAFAAAYGCARRVREGYAGVAAAGAPQEEKP